jgi:hypothetical protein
MTKQGIHVHMSIVSGSIVAGTPDKIARVLPNIEWKATMTEHRVVGVDRKATLEEVLSRVSAGLAALARKKLGAAVEDVVQPGALGKKHHVEVDDGRDYAWITVTPCEVVA